MIILGDALGIGLGSVAAMTGRWEVILLLVPVIGLYLVGYARRRPGTLTPRAWIWPAVALFVTPATFLLVPPNVAPVGLGLAIAIWFGLIVVGGVLEVVLDPDGRLANTPE